MNVWVVTSEELGNYSFLIGVYDSQEKARTAATQYLKDLGYTDVDINYEEDEISEYWNDKYSDDAVIIEHTRLV